MGLCGGAVGAAAVLAGSTVEFWWPALAVTLFTWSYCRRPRWSMLLLWGGSLAALCVIHRNLWAMAALPMIFAASQVRIDVPRGRLGFYVYYPTHLALLWGLARLL